ncbi:hypothetical protein BV22DRAFT_639624 [Leucogyrophana mollusca]|uniref:Uncharacterized protein n=1 Tax=Leucogyrophana mollusca TaxID=85980 RepID=A0ACB8BA84_9AGAM|nr:hypothetical protein BV22DRAFT_639624 [Leucogyrophana mollusca]
MYCSVIAAGQHHQDISANAISHSLKNKPVGVVNNFDLASPGGCTSSERTSTIPFMAVRLPEEYSIIKLILSPTGIDTTLHPWAWSLSGSAPDTTIAPSLAGIDASMMG